LTLTGRRRIPILTFLDFLLGKSWPWDDLMSERVSLCGAPRTHSGDAVSERDNTRFAWGFHEI